MVVVHGPADFEVRLTTRRKGRLTPIPPGKYVLKPKKHWVNGEHDAQNAHTICQGEETFMECSENIQDINVPDNNHGMYDIIHNSFCKLIVCLFCK
jgi:hypothetical protein